jgi:hypothetical protein
MLFYASVILARFRLNPLRSNKTWVSSEVSKRFFGHRYCEQQDSRPRVIDEAAGHIRLDAIGRFVMPSISRMILSRSGCTIARAFV